MAEYVTATDNISLTTYYFCAGLIMIFLFLGLQCAKILTGFGREFYQKLNVAKIGSTSQIVSTYFALLCCFSMLYAIVAIVTAIIKPQFALGIICSYLILFPVCALLMLVFELVENTANAILTLFVVIVVLGFVSGFFFPLSMLPQTFDTVSKFTVTRAMLEYTKGCMTNGSTLPYLFAMMVHCAVLLLFAIMIRKHRIKN